MQNRYKDGKLYETFINKFIKGQVISDVQNFYDLETKNYIYEVKGTKLQEKNKSSLGRYKIFIENHNRFKQIGDEKNKKAKYGFVLKIDGRMLYKILSWEAVNILVLRGKKHINKQQEKEVVNVSLKEIW